MSRKMHKNNALRDTQRIQLRQQRGSYRGVFCKKKNALYNFSKFTGKRPYLSPSFDEVAPNRLKNLSKKDYCTGTFFDFGEIF